MKAPTLTFGTHLVGYGFVLYFGDTEIRVPYRQMKRVTTQCERDVQQYASIKREVEARVGIKL